MREEASRLIESIRGTEAGDAALDEGSVDAADGGDFTRSVYVWLVCLLSFVHPHEAGLGLAAHQGRQFQIGHESEAAR